MARNSEPALRRKTPLLICSIRTEIPYPCADSRAKVFRMSISRVPWTRSLGFSGIKSLDPPGYQEEHMLLLLIVKRSDMVGLRLSETYCKAMITGETIRPLFEGSALAKT